MQFNIKKSNGYNVVRTNLIGTSKVTKEKGDTLKRSFIRHDPDKLGKELYAIIRKDFFESLSVFMKGWLQ